MGNYLITYTPPPKVFDFDELLAQQPEDVQAAVAKQYGELLASYQQRRQARLDLQAARRRISRQTATMTNR